MPFINVTTSQKLTEEQKKVISGDLGAIVGILPHKTEQVLMISFTDGCTMYNKGLQSGNCVFIEVKIYGSAGFSFKKDFTEKVFALVSRNLGTKTEDIYIAVGEYSTWGTMGSLK